MVYCLYKLKAGGGDVIAKRVDKLSSIIYRRDLGVFNLFFSIQMVSNFWRGVGIIEVPVDHSKEQSFVEGTVNYDSKGTLTFAKHGSS